MANLGNYNVKNGPWLFRLNYMDWCLLLLKHGQLATCDMDFLKVYLKSYHMI